MGTCKCGKEMFLFDEGLNISLYICPHCKNILEINKHYHLIEWKTLEDANITIKKDYNGTITQKFKAMGRPRKD